MSRRSPGGFHEGHHVRGIRLDGLGCAAVRPGTARASLSLDPRQHWEPDREPVFRAHVRAAQTVLAGRRKLTIGWVSPLIVEIRVLDGEGRPVANGQGSGTLWATPEVDWKPGEYSIELAAAGETMRQSLHFLPPDKGPKLPSELGDPTDPEPLRAVAAGAWYAAEDPAFLLEALQHVAPDASSSRPARLLTLAFIEGKRPSPQPLGGRGEGEGHGGARSGDNARAPPSTR